MPSGWVSETDVVTEVTSTVAPALFEMVPLASTAQRSRPCDVAVTDALQATSPDGHGLGAVDVVVGVSAVAVAVDVVRSPSVVVDTRELVVVLDAPSGSVVVVMEAAVPASMSSDEVAVVLERGTVARVGASSVVVVRAAAVATRVVGSEGRSSIPAATRMSPAPRSSARGRPKAIMTRPYVPRPTAA